MRSTAEGSAGITTDGLVRYYDIANQYSYIGSNTSLTNLAGAAINMSLINGPTYTANFNGGFSFDGVNDYFEIPYFSIGSSSFAVDIWVQLIPTASYLQGIISCGDIWQSINGSTLGWCIGYNTEGSLSYGITFRTGSNLSQKKTSTNVTSFDRPSNIFIHKNTSTEKFVTYINGVKTYDTQLSSDTSFTSESFTNRSPIRSRIYGPNNFTAGYGTPYPTGSIHNIKIYHDKNFTEAEILQNFNALKYRYGM